MYAIERFQTVQTGWPASPRFMDGLFNNVDSKNVFAQRPDHASMCCVAARVRPCTVGWAPEFLYDFFRNLYEEESERYGQLEVRARLYITILVLFGCGRLKHKGYAHADRAIVRCTRTSYRIRNRLHIGAFVLPYCHKNAQIRGAILPYGLIDSFGGTLPSEDDFREDRIVDFAVATERNAAQNDRVARALSWAIIFIFGGVGLHVTAFLTTLYI
jgi:hypothetical protein